MDSSHDRPAPFDASATLVDFGGGRRLERLGGILVDRPLPQARNPRGDPGLWLDVGLTYTGAPSGGNMIGQGQRRCDLPPGWECHVPIPDPWLVSVPLDDRPLVLGVRPAGSGQTGLFLEQVPLWAWLARAAAPGSRILSLFAHSGAASLAAAIAGAEVTHVDASRQALALARHNAAANALDTAPVRWVCEDAGTFVKRELRRGRRYDGVVLDPPSWGHGPRGEAFAIDRDLEPLLHDLARLLPAEAKSLWLLSCHSPCWTPARLALALSEASGIDHGIDSGHLRCTDSAGRFLELGAFARHAPR